MKDFFTTEIRYDGGREGPAFTCEACAEVRCAVLRQRIMNEALAKRDITPDKLLEFAGVWQREGLPEEAERIRLHAKRLEKDSLETT